MGGGNPTPSRIWPLLSYSNKEKGEKERGAGPPSPIRFGLGRLAPHLGMPPLFHHLAHEAH